MFDKPIKDAANIRATIYKYEDDYLTVIYARDDSHSMIRSAVTITWKK
jgi:hypothetical protein